MLLKLACAFGVLGAWLIHGLDTGNIYGPGVGRIPGGAHMDLLVDPGADDPDKICAGMPHCHSPPALLPGPLTDRCEQASLHHEQIYVQDGAPVTDLPLSSPCPPARR